MIARVRSSMGLAAHARGSGCSGDETHKASGRSRNRPRYGSRRSLYVVGDRRHLGNVRDVEDPADGASRIRERQRCAAEVGTLREPKEHADALRIQVRQADHVECERSSCPGQVGQDGFGLGNVAHVDLADDRDPTGAIPMHGFDSQLRRRSRHPQLQDDCCGRSPGRCRRPSRVRPTRAPTPRARIKRWLRRSSRVGSRWPLRCAEAWRDRRSVP